MKILKSIAATVVALGMLTTTPAHSREFADVYAECGLGAMVFSGDSENNRLLAIISNVTWDLGTTAHLSNLSSESNCKNGEAQTAAFIMQTYPAIERDLAVGEGEFLHAMLDFRGCDSAVRSSIISDLRGDLANAIADQGAGDAEMLYNTLESRVSASYGASCVI